MKKLKFFLSVITASVMIILTLSQSAMASSYDWVTLSPQQISTSIPFKLPLSELKGEEIEGMVLERNNEFVPISIQISNNEAIIKPVIDLVGNSQYCLKTFTTSGNKYKMNLTTSNAEGVSLCNMPLNGNAGYSNYIKSCWIDSQNKKCLSGKKDYLKQYGDCQNILIQNHSSDTISFDLPKGATKLTAILCLDKLSTGSNCTVRFSTASSSVLYEQELTRISDDLIINVDIRDVGALFMTVHSESAGDKFVNLINPRVY